MYRIICALLLFVSAYEVWGQPPTSESEQQLISPSVLLGTRSADLQQFAKRAGYESSLESTDDSIQYVYVEAKTYSLAIYLENDSSWIARIFTQKDKAKPWLAYLDNLVKTKSNVWSKSGKDQYLYKEEELEPVVVDVIKESSGYKRFILEFHR